MTDPSTDTVHRTSSIRRRRPPLALGVVAAVVVLVAGACSGGSDDAGEQAATTSPDAPPLTLPGGSDTSDDDTIDGSDDTGDGSGVETDDDLPAGWVSYESEGISIGHPEEWTVGDDARAAIVLMIDPQGVTFRRNINVIVQGGGGSTTLDEYVEISDQQLAESGATVSESGPTTLDGLPAHQWRYITTASNVEVEVLTVATIEDGSAYLVTYTSDPSNFDERLTEVEESFATVDLP